MAHPIRAVGMVMPPYKSIRVCCADRPDDALDTGAPAVAASVASVEAVDSVALADCCACFIVAAARSLRFARSLARSALETVGRLAGLPDVDLDVLCRTNV